MSMCGICWFDGRSLTDEMDDLRQRVKEFEARERLEKEAADALSRQPSDMVLDAKRLDWIDTLGSSGLGHLGYGDYRYYVHGEGYPKVREVIDKAMLAAAEKEKP